MGVGKLQASLRNPVERVLLQDLLNAAPADAEGLGKHAPYTQRQAKGPPCPGQHPGNGRCQLNLWKKVGRAQWSHDQRRSDRDKRRDIGNRGIVAIAELLLRSVDAARVIADEVHQPQHRKDGKNTGSHQHIIHACVGEANGKAGRHAKVERRAHRDFIALPMLRQFAGGDSC